MAITATATATATVVILVVQPVVEPTTIIMEVKAALMTMTTMITRIAIIRIFSK